VSKSTNHMTICLGSTAQLLAQQSLYLWRPVSINDYFMEVSQKYIGRFALQKYLSSPEVEQLAAKIGYTTQ